jgi:hypothetical protein
VKTRHCQRQTGLLARQLFPVFPCCLLLCAALSISCATTPAAPPEWALYGVDAAWPREAYIAATGCGGTTKQAEQDAYAALSFYFIAVVSSRSYSHETWTSDAAHYAKYKSSDSETFVHSTINLFALRRSSLWYDPYEKTYYTVAYIDRAEAWAIFEPRVRKEADEFRALWRIAESESAALKSYFDYKRTLEYTRRTEFANTMNFGDVLYPQKMNALISDMRENTAQLSSKLNEARSMAKIFINCPLDFESSITAALAKLFSGEGLPVTTDKSNAAAICTVTVEEGFWRSEGVGDFYYPKIGVIITDISGNALFSYSASAGKQAAMNAEVAKRRAYSALAAALENNFSVELNREFGVVKH